MVYTDARTIEEQCPYRVPLRMGLIAPKLDQSPDEIHSIECPASFWNCETHALVPIAQNEANLAIGSLLMPSQQHR